MAERKKTSSKKTKTKSAVKGTEPGDLPFGVILCGWILVGVGLVLLLGCVSSVYSGTEGNWLGPYFGKLIPETFCFIFGKLPVVAFTFALVLWGLCLALRPVRMRGIGLAVGMSLLTIDLACLLALKNYGESQLGRDVLMMNGGIVGQFFCKNIAEPVFGNVSALAPFLLLLAGLVLILVISFGLRPRHFAFVVSGFRWLVGLFMKRGKDDETAEEDDTESGVVSENIGLSKRKGITFLDDDTIFKEPDGFKLKHKGKLKPFSARKNWMETPVLARGNGEELDESTVAPTIAPTMPAAPVAADQAIEPDFTGEDPEILRLEQQLRDNYRNMSALEIKEIRDKIAEIRRAREMLNWERAHQNKIVVKGAVRGTQPDALPAETRDDATVVAENESERTVVAGQKQPDVAPRIAAFPGTEKDDEPTLAAGGDVSSEEETFMPEIVTSDEAERDPTMEQDPTYEAPNQIGTSSSGTSFTGGAANGIPQPDPTVHYDPYRIPTVDEILDKHDPQPADYTEEELNAIGRMLEEKLENFKVKGKVVGCETGPVITRFEVEPGPGVKVSQFSALQDDLAMALKAVSIRILAPIPGKGAVGIEIPNRKMQTIFGRDIFESDAFKPSPDKIIMALGKDISGEPFAMDLAKAPHLMIAGQTGSGKSVCINALMASMLLSKTPDELRMILVDPKAVELKMYENIPHLLAPVITKPEVAIQALQWLCYEMDRRTEVLAKAKVRNLNGFNEKFDAGLLPEDVPDTDRGHRMAFIVVIIDEMADLMMVAGKEIEKNVSRLAAKARAVGIHLVLATQRPSVKVITGNIKANLPTRISFKVASQVDARTVMDHAGAEKLLGRGDMLFKAVNAPDPVRVHGAFLSDEEAEKLADACSNQNVCYPQLETFEVEEAGGEGDDDDGNAAMNEKKDKLLFEVAKWAIECGNGLSTSAVQRHFSVGYSRAGKIVDQLYGMGLCARSTGNSKPRAMLIGMDELMQLERSGAFR
ncbi:DNA translocase FtsK [uncultured Fibrobacter sp.]|uniref:DNA translocase FtsK n=1 Tax=uncultured Fibrobacter sp. TaxID=261512 RepID=UPI0025D52F06|nr:DNA translocase FtsK [uncultured Fibrobacter sp.]